MKLIEVEMEVVRFDVEDIITTSGEDEGPAVDPFG